MDATLEHNNEDHDEDEEEQGDDDVPTITTNNIILILPWLPDNTKNDDEQPNKHKHSCKINMNDEAPLSLDQECWEKHPRPTAKL